MATIKKYKDWSFANQGLLVDLLNNGAIQEGDIRAINNYNNLYSEKEQLFSRGELSKILNK